ncbi:MAG: thiamine pyrophosphate-dependent enzyme [Acidimicrobiia bacterium]
MAGPLSDNDVLGLLTEMIRARRWSTRLFNLQRQGRAGTVAPIDGMEAAVVASAAALDPTVDWVFPQYREPVALSAFGKEVLYRVCLYERGHPDGCHYPPDVHVFPTQISIAAQLPHAVGFAWGLKLREVEGVALAYFGDGASSEGDAHEAMNLAAVQKIPVIFLCVDNGWAISTSRSHQSAAPSIALRAAGVGMAGEEIDGNDLVAVYSAVAEARARALAGEGPSLIVATSYRLGPHTTADDPTRYVPPDELAAHRAVEPVERWSAWLAERGMWDASRQQAAETEADDLFDEAWARAEVAVAQPADLFANAYAALTPQLIAQRDELSKTDN